MSMTDCLPADRVNDTVYEVCDHCGRSDVGSWKAGRAVVKLLTLDPYDQKHKTLGTKVLVVCSPRVADRPKCVKLVSTYHHGPHCAVCMAYNPPGTELRFRTRLVGTPQPMVPTGPPSIACPTPQPIPDYIKQWAANTERTCKVPDAVVEAARRALVGGWTINEFAAGIGISAGRAKSVIRRHDLSHLCHPGRGGGRLRQRVILFDAEEFA